MNPGVVVGYDQMPSSEGALEQAAAEAVRRGTVLRVVHAFHRPRTASPSEMPVGGEDAPYSTVQAAAVRVRADHPGLTVDAEAVAGSAPAVLADQSADADLVVVGHRGRGGFAGLRLGSVALRTMARVGCPMIVVRGGGSAQTRGTVLAAVDIAGTAEAAHEILAFAFAEAAQRGARMKVIGALEMFWPPAYAGDTGQLGRASSQAVERAGGALERLVRPWLVKYPDVCVEHELMEGSPTAILTAATTYSDLIVVGARRRRGEGHGMRVGPVGDTLLLHSDCPVAVVPHD
jgi:nucleotide-binding universal stress UspA family protein